MCICTQVFFYRGLRDWLGQGTSSKAEKPKHYGDVSKKHLIILGFKMHSSYTVYQLDRQVGANPTGKIRRKVYEIQESACASADFVHDYVELLDFPKMKLPD